MRYVNYYIGWIWVAPEMKDGIRGLQLNFWPMSLRAIWRPGQYTMIWIDWHWELNRRRL